MRVSRLLRFIFPFSITPLTITFQDTQWRIISPDEIKSCYFKVKILKINLPCISWIWIQIGKRCGELYVNNSVGNLTLFSTGGPKEKTSAQSSHWGFFVCLGLSRPSNVYQNSRFLCAVFHFNGAYQWLRDTLLLCQLVFFNTGTMLIVGCCGLSYI